MQQCKRWLAVLALLMTCCSDTGEASGLSSDFSAEGMVRIALQKSPVVAAARSRIEQDQAKVRGAESGFYPRVDASLSWTRIKEAQSMTIPGAGTLELASEQTWKAALALQQVLYSGGTLQANRRAALLGLDATRADEVRTLQAIATSARKAFYDLQRARARRQVAEEALALAKEHLRQVQAFYDNGLVAKNEVLRVQVSVSNGQLDLIRAANAVDVAWSALERVTGTPLRREERELPLPGEELPPDYALGDEESAAIASRPELRGLESSRNAALAVAVAEAGQARPQIALQGEVFAADDAFFPENDDWRISLAAEWRVYDGGEIQSKVDQSKAQAEELLHRLDDFERQIRLEVSTARFDYLSARQRVAVARDQVASAEEDYRIALKRYAAQVGTNIDVLDARLALNDARISAVDAVYDVWKGLADLKYAVGDETFPGLTD